MAQRQEERTEHLLRLEEACRYSDLLSRTLTDLMCNEASRTFYSRHLDQLRWHTLSAGDTRDTLDELQRGMLAGEAWQ